MSHRLFQAKLFDYSILLPGQAAAPWAESERLPHAEGSDSSFVRFSFNLRACTCVSLEDVSEKEGIEWIPEHECIEIHDAAAYEFKSISKATNITKPI